MAKKSQKQAGKKSSKQEQAVADQPVKDKKQTKQRKQKANQSKEQSNDQVQLLPQGLQERFNQFGSLLNQINKFSQSLQKGNAFDIHQKQSQLSKRIQQECQNIFKQEIKEAQNWIEDAQVTLNNNTSKLNEAYEKTRAIFQQTNQFKKEQIDSALSIFDTKFDQIKERAVKYQNLRDKALNTYI